MVRRIRRALDQAGIPFDKKAFRPHITLVRKPVTAGKEPAVLPTADAQSASMTVDRFVLFRSDPGRNHMIYTPLAVFEADPAEAHLTGE